MKFHRLAVAAAFAGALFPAFSCDSSLGTAGVLTIHVVGDGSFDARAVARVTLRVDGDGPSPATRDLPTPSGLPASLDETYQPAAPAVLVVGAVAVDASGIKVASGLAQPVSVGGAAADVTVVLSSAGAAGDGGTIVDGSVPTDGGAPDLVGKTCNPMLCPLGCNFQLDRCNRPLPTNLGTAPPEGELMKDVVVSGGAALDTATGKAYVNNQQVDLGFVYSVQDGTQPNGAPRLAVFGAKSLTIQPGAVLRVFDSANGMPGNAALFLVAGDVTINGRVEAGAIGTNGMPGFGRRSGPGGWFGSGTDGNGQGPAGCGGGSGASSGPADDGGGGGGAMAGRGGTGSHGGGAKSGAGGMTTLPAPSPLQGGCGGGSGSNSTGGARSEGGGGGGAIEFSAGGTLTVGGSGSIDVAGNGGAGGADVSAGGGGGAGGMVVLEAAIVTVAGGGFVASNGGGGGAGGNGFGMGAGQPGQPGPANLSPAIGGASASTGGLGGWGNSPTGADAPFAGSSNGGGGGAGAGAFVSIAAQTTIAPASYSAVYTAMKVMQVY